MLTSTYKLNSLPGSDGDVGLHVLGCRLDMLGTNCKQGRTSPYICITVLTSLANTKNAHGQL